MLDTKFYGIREDGVKLYRTYSTLGLKLRKIGTTELYAEAIDLENTGYKYEETDIPIEPIPLEDDQVSDESAE